MKKTLSWGTALICMSVLPASAEDAGAESLLESLDSIVTRLDAVEVTANRAGVKTPVAFTNVNAKEIAKGNDGRDIPSLLEMTPSIISTGDAGAGIGY
ncbi:MAG: TonB-dependent receptor, partial [Muribaculaceae bacterium]|nr:TonB-dependent receptor [Muribaculaceae bacterium]